MSQSANGMWNHVTVTEGGEVLMEFDSDQVFDIGSIITLLDDTDAYVVGVTSSAKGHPPAEVAVTQVLVVQTRRGSA